MTTKTIKTSDLIGPALDWAVAKCEEHPAIRSSANPALFLGMHSIGGQNYSSDWSRGGPIIERERIELGNWGIEGWEAKATNYTFLNTPQEEATFATKYGDTALIAAMRCYVVSKMGDTVDIPEELC